MHLGLEAAVAQELRWRELQQSTHTNCAMVYDVARARFVAISGSRTMEWDGRAWQTRATAHAPAGWAGTAMAYDRAQQRTVLFGGNAGGPYGTSMALNNDTFEYDGNDWIQRTPAVSPPVRFEHAMACDSTRGRVVLTGGRDQQTYLTDTWEWNGTTWTQVANLGPGVARAPMAFHSASGNTVLFGGYDAQGLTARTWTWNGAAWTLQFLATAPPLRAQHGMSEDRARGVLVMFGGGTDSRVWEWTGTNWRIGAAAAGPQPRTGCGMAGDDAGNTMLLGGVFASNAFPVTDYVSFGDTWQHANGQWTQLATTGPPERSDPLMTYDVARDRVVLTGAGSGNVTHTWEWNGTAWNRIPTSTEPPMVFFGCLCYDRANAATVWYGGLTTGLFATAVTFTWNGTTWTQQNVSGPPARSAHAMTFDTVRNVVLLFGGSNGGIGVIGSLLNDTWQWNGTAWSQVANGGPPPRTSHALAFDEARGRAVLFGGSGKLLPGFVTQALGDTWEWNGSTWSAAQPSVSPAPRWSAAMAYSPARGRTVLVGGTALDDTGFSSLAALREQWEWDGTNWTGGPRDILPVTAMNRLPMVYDQRLGGLVLMRPVFQGQTQISNDLWLGASSAASAVAGGSGCGGARQPALQGLGQPVLGRSEFAIELTTASASALFLLGVGTTTGSIALAPSCTLYPAGVTTTASGTTNAAGFAPVAVPIPAAPALLGAEAVFQAGQLDPTSPSGFALTNWVRVRPGI